MLGVISEGGVFQITGTNPYITRRISGCPGTTKPYTVVCTPIGVVYEAHDGVRCFNGTTAPLLGYDAIGRVFRGESLGNISAFSGEVAEYARGEYFISDESQTLALNLEKKTWRDLGVGCSAFHYAGEADILAATISSQVLDFEKEGEVTDHGTDISFEIEPCHARLSDEKEQLLRHIHIDMNSSGQSLSFTLLHDSSETPLGSLVNSAREIVTLNVGKFARVIGLRISGDISQRIELFGVEFDVYTAREVP
jgi:hypothetical protein